MERLEVDSAAQADAEEVGRSVAAHGDSDPHRLVGAEGEKP